jgi:hypothetical protein
MPTVCEEISFMRWGECILAATLLVVALVLVLNCTTARAAGDLAALVCLKE